MVISLQRGQCQESLSGEKPEDRMLGWLESGDVQPGLSLTTQTSWLQWKAVAVGASDSLMRKGTGLTVYMLSNFLDPLFLAQKQTT